MSKTNDAPPNQSLKLTEPAVDDFARAKQPATVGRDLPRADWIPSPQLSSDPLGGKNKLGFTKKEIVSVIQASFFDSSFQRYESIGSQIF